MFLVKKSLSRPLPHVPNFGRETLNLLKEERGGDNAGQVLSARTDTAAAAAAASSAMGLLLVQ